MLLQSAEHIRYYAGWADKIFGKVAPTSGNFQAIVYREPLGESLSVIDSASFGVPCTSADHHFRYEAAILVELSLFSAQKGYILAFHLCVFLCRCGWPDHSLELPPSHGSM